MMFDFEINKYLLFGKEKECVLKSCPWEKALVMHSVRKT
jgi:hypothetical protein